MLAGLAVLGLGCWVVALGGASGGYVSGRREIVGWLRQRSRPYLFSNTLAPSIAATSIHVLDMLQGSDELRRRLRDNAAFFRGEMMTLGFRLVPGEHPIVPIMLGEAKVASELSRKLLERGIYVIGFSFPVVPEGKARIRVQLSAAHSAQHIDHCASAFAAAGREMGIVR